MRTARPVRVLVNGRPVELTRKGDGLVEFATRKGATYRLEQAE